MALISLIQFKTLNIFPAIVLNWCPWKFTGTSVNLYYFIIELVIKSMFWTIKTLFMVLIMIKLPYHCMINSGSIDVIDDIIPERYIIIKA